MEVSERPWPLETGSYDAIAHSSSTELRGCLLNKVLDMRKRSLVRTDTQDSGFSLESQDLVTTSFDAEKFLEDLGFAGATEPLIPDRFIPSLIHRVSYMPDETVKQLDVRVWKSIDSFKKKEHVSWFFSSSVECDLCINNMRRGRSLPTAFPQESCDSWHPGNHFRNNSNPVFRIQSWLSRLPYNNSIAWEETTPVNTKLNIANIRNQSSTESGILSFEAGDEVLTASTNLESDDFGDLCSSFDRADDFGAVEPQLESSGSSHKALNGKNRLSETITSRTTPAINAVCDTHTMKTTTFLFPTATANGQSRTPPPESTSVFAASICKWSPMSVGEEKGCTNHNSKNLNGFFDDEDKSHEQTNSNPISNRDYAAEFYEYYTSEDANVTALANSGEVTAKSEVSEGEISDHVEGHFRKHLKKMSTDGMLFLMLPDNLDKMNSDTVNNHLCLEPNSNDFHCLTCNTELEGIKKDADLFFSLTKGRDVNQCDSVSAFSSKKKRHSFDAAYASSTAAEKRKLFRLTHAQSHNFLFGRKREGSSQSSNRVSEVVTAEATSRDSGILSDLQEDSQCRDSETCRELLPQEQDSGFREASSHSGSTEDNSFETFRTASSFNTISDSDSSEQYVSCDEFSTENTCKSSADEASDFANHNHTEQEAVRNDFTNFVVSLPEEQELASVKGTPPEQYSSDEFCTENMYKSHTDEASDFADQNRTEQEGVRVNSANVVVRIPDEQGLASVESTSQTFSKDNCSFQKYYRRPFAPTFEENFVLNKILSQTLKLSILDQEGEKSKHSMLENGQSESFSQILNINDSSSLLESKALKPNVQSLTGMTRSSYDALSGPGMSVKSIDREPSDKTEAADNGQYASKPFVHRLLSHSSDMSTPKYEVRLINYDGWALFSPARNPAGSNIGYDLGIASMHMNSDIASNKRFTSGIRMEVNRGDENKNNEVYFNEVYLEVNGGDAEKGSQDKRFVKSIVGGKFHLGKGSRNEVRDEFFKDTKVSTNTENPCRRALKDLEDLRIAIQKAKETRMSASRELKLLLELLQGGDNGEDEISLERTSAEESTLSSPALKSAKGNRRENRTKALSELQQKSAKDTSQGKEFWEEEIKKAKEEIGQVCHEKLGIMEQKLRTTEEELARALEENVRLKDQLELRSAELPVCKCNAEAHNSDFSHMNGISDEDPAITSVVVKPSIPTKNFWQEWDRLHSDLMKAESKADELNILLNQKLIELNKMQLTLSKQTKQMILLEMAYFQLRSHLSKRRLNKSAQSHQSSSSFARASSSITETASEDSSKASDPEIPP